MRRYCLVFVCLVALMTATAQETDDLIHSVVAGETLITIANAYGVSLDQLLTLNNLDPDAYLQIGQLLLVIPDALQGDAEARGDGATEDGDAESEDKAVGTIAAAVHQAAPVVEASAPMMDPADLSPQICFTIYADENQSGMREPSEARLGAGELILFDTADIEQLHYTTDGESEPYCLRDLGRHIYRLEAVAPAGYGLSGASSLWLDLRAGGSLQLEFGARQGQETVAGPLFETKSDLDTLPAGNAAGLLRDLSGLVVMAMAAAVLVSGAAVAVFLRSR